MDTGKIVATSLTGSSGKILNRFHYMKSILSASVIALLACGTAASATTINIGAFSVGALASASGGLGNLATEDFEVLGATNGVGEVAVGTALSTNVGEFEAGGGVGSGGTVSGLAGNTGQNVALRNGDVFGRSNVSGDGGFFLDSNDTFGIGWTVNTGAAFDTILFTVRDASEFSFLRITVNGVSAEQRVGAAFANGATSLVEISLAASVQSLRVDLMNYTSFAGSNTTNDGFSIDDIAVGLSAVPVPAGLPLMLVGAGAFAAARRKQRKA